MPKITIPKLKQMKADAEKITMLTAYDYPTARLLDQMGIDILLVGDSPTCIHSLAPCLPRTHACIAATHTRRTTRTHPTGTQTHTHMTGRARADGGMCVWVAASAPHTVRSPHCAFARAPF